MRARLPSCPGALIVSIICLVVLLYSCSARATRPNWQWSSESGRRCYYDCEARLNDCRANCTQSRGGFILICASYCDEGREACLKTCPDLAQLVS